MLTRFPARRAFVTTNDQIRANWQHEPSAAFFFFLDPVEINEDDNHYVNVLEDMWQYMNPVFHVS